MARAIAEGSGVEMGMKIGGLDDRSWWQDRCELVMIGVDAMKQ